MAQLLTSLDNFPSELRGGAVAIGNFDGVHRGHAALLAQLTEQARRLGGPAIVLTFDPPPVAILVPDRPPSLPLTTIRRRADLLGRLHVNALIAYPTDRALLSLEPDEFFEQKIVQAMGARAIVEGPNFRFGKDRAGDTDMLAHLCHSAGMDLTLVAPQTDGSNEMISSTRIRQLLADGNVAGANRLLTQAHRISGIVAKGAQRGRQLGFPTANLCDLRSMLPAQGVYAGVTRLDEQEWTCAVHIGPNPTFGEQQDKVEIHVLDWSGDLYGEEIECSLLARIRGVQRFQSASELQAQLTADLAACRQAVSRNVDA